MNKITTKIASAILSSYFRLFMSVLMLAVAAFGAGRAYSYDEFDRPRSSPPIVQEQRSSGTNRPGLQRYELIVKNRSSANITQIYARSINMNNWSIDLIPSYTVKPGRQGLVNLYDGGGSCEWRVKAVLEDGRVAEKAMNVCNLDTYTVY